VNRQALAIEVRAFGNRFNRQDRPAVSGLLADNLDRGPLLDRLEVGTSRAVADLRVTPRHGLDGQLRLCEESRFDLVAHRGQPLTGQQRREVLEVGL
jgi:hypothetical protein